MRASVGRVTTLARDKGELRTIEIDTPLAPGAIGGPAVNEQGEVIGIAGFSAAAAELKFLAPAERLREFLNRPHVDAVVPEFSAESLHVPKRVEVTLTSFQAEALEPTVEFSLRKDDAKPTSFVLAPDGANQFAGMVSIPQGEKASGIGLKCKVAFTSGVMEGSLVDTAFQINGEQVMLADVSRMEFSFGKATIVFRNETENKAP